MVICFQQYLEFSNIHKGDELKEMIVALLCWAILREWFGHGRVYPLEEMLATNEYKVLLMAHLIL